jgi:hypothetical protein
LKSHLSIIPTQPPPRRRACYKHDTQRRIVASTKPNAGRPLHPGCPLTVGL